MDRELSWDVRLIQPFLRNGWNITLALPALKRRAILGQRLEFGLCPGSLRLFDRYAHWASLPAETTRVKGAQEFRVHSTYLGSRS
jgi:hypothetical protein